MGEAPFTKPLDLGAVLSAADLSGAAAVRTATITTLYKKYSRLILYLDYTYGAATAVTITPTVSPNSGTTYYSKTSTAIAAGAGTLSAYVDTLTGTASFKIAVEYDVSGLDAIKFVFAGSGSPTSSDLLTVRAVAVVG